MNITQPDNIPADIKSDIKGVCLKIGPILLGDKMVKFADSDNPSTNEINQVFEAITREFWRQQIQVYRTEVATKLATQTVIEETSVDLFA